MPTQLGRLTALKWGMCARRARPPPRTYHTPLAQRCTSLSPLSPPPAGAPLARRGLHDNSLSGTLPTQLGRLTALRIM